MNKQSNSSSALTVDEARSAVLTALPVNKQTEQIPVAKAPGRVISKDIRSSFNIPPFRNSAMDGFAIRHADFQTNNTFNITGQSLAGHPFQGNIPPHGSVRITTGAMVPPDADTIVIQENTTVTDNTVAVNKAPEPFQHIRNPGDDIKSGALVIKRNTPLGAAHAGLLAAQGMDSIEVYKLPRIGVFSTGDELCNAGQSLTEGMIFDSNRASICALIANAGFSADDLGIARDNQADIQSVLNESNYDFLLSSGGVSVGEADHVKAALESNGTLNFWKVAMKPGKPMVTGRLQSGSFYFGLPGNPVSSLVTCIQFVIPALRSFAGHSYQSPPLVQAICETELAKEAGRFEFQRGIFKTEGGIASVTSTGMQDSHVLSSMSRANCFICLEANTTYVKAGDAVNIILFSTLPGLA